MVADAYAACLEIARTHYENFPVASRLLPAPMRPHIAAIYAFARGADDIADEPGRAPDERLALLDEWREHLHGSPRDAVFDALADTRAKFDLPTALFDDLLSAFRQDVDDHEVRHLGRGARLLPPVGQSRRPPRAACCGISTAAARRVVGRRVHGAAAHQLLAGPGDRLATRPALSAREEWAPPVRSTADLDRACDVARVEDGLGRCRRSNACRFLRWTADLRCGSRPAALRAAGDLARRRARSSTDSSEVDFDVFTRRPRLRRRDALVIGLETLLTWPATPRSTTRS